MKRFFSIVIVILLVAVIYLLTNNSYNNHEPTELQTVTPSAIDEEKFSDRFTYQFLGKAEASFYRNLVELFENHEDSLELGDISPDDVGMILSYVLADYPEYFWIPNSYVLQTTKLRDNTTYYSVNFEYTMEIQQRKLAQLQLEAAADVILSEIDPTWSDYEKVKAVYDHIIITTDYSLDVQDDQSLYSTMVDGVGVCAGYAKSMQYLLNELDIFCSYVVGDIIGRDSHAWNLVKLDGNFYYVDPTWGDPVFNPGTFPSDYISYDYFCITTQDILKTHRIDENWPVAYCGSTDLNYYSQTGALLDSYTRESIVVVMEEALLRGESEFSFRFTNEVAYTDAVSTLFSEDGVFSVFDELRGAAAGYNPPIKISYMLNEDLYIIKVW